MIRRISRLCAGTVTAFGVTLLVIATLGVRPGFAQTVPACQLTGDIVIELFDGTAVRSDLDEQGATNGPFAIAIPSGSYELSLMSFDRHSSEDGSDPQTREQWFLRGLDGGSVVFESAAISDLPEDVDVLTEIVHGNVDIPALDAVVAVHAAFGSASAQGTNSVQPICAALTAVDATTTSQATTTTTQATTTTTTQATTTTTAATTSSSAEATTTTSLAAENAGGSAQDDGDDDGTGVLGNQISQEELPFTGLTDPQVAMAGAVMVFVGTLVLVATREERTVGDDLVVRY